ncbi:MAG: molybdopterin-synthase adenylyltransferase MoeB [Actinobacteria bacterium]|nr:molybdopterin-synthase adenylyltransferase MoeB [Actinomycetota bacterium]
MSTRARHDGSVTFLPPLVDLGPELSRQQIERYSRHLLVPGIGMSGQRRLAGARVCVVGAGGLGCPAMIYLAAAGVGRITVIDHDVVDLSNLQRQVLHRTADVGVPKVTSAARALRELNPLIQVDPRHTEVSAETVRDLLREHDVVIDGTDNFATRYLVADAGAELGIPVVWAAVLRYDAQVATFVPAPWVPAQEAVSLRDLFPTTPPPEAVPSCADAGVLGAMVGQVGSIMATEAVKLITGVGEPLVGRVLLIDVAAMRMREIPLRPNPSRGMATVTRQGEAVPGQPSDPLPEAVATVRPTELAGRLDQVRVLDVREPEEHALGTVPGALRVPLTSVLTWTEADMAAELGADPVVVTCKVGPRAQRAAQHLIELGHPEVRVLAGGMLGWIDEVDGSLVRY